jgi:prepilin-type N-terminal cleavage/methylation domain-containing protein
MRGGDDKWRGFTIVELLIVVVVIAILATITIVSYNGIAKQAEESRFLATVDTFEKALRLYQAENGEYPSTRTGPNTSMYTCLGESYPETDDLPENQCLTLITPTTTIPFTTKLTTVDDALKEMISTLPAVDYKVYKATDPAGNTVLSRGIIYESILNDPPVLMYYIPLDGQCGRGVKSMQEDFALAACKLELK